MRWFVGLIIHSGCPSQTPPSETDDPGGTTPPGVDEDGDGFTVDQDCNDADPTIRPDATEVPYDGVDNDCDPGTPDDDLDGDSYLLADDCQDDDASVHPGAVEVEGNGIDDDCDPFTCTGSGFAEQAVPWALPPRETDGAAVSQWPSFRSGGQLCIGGVHAERSSTFEVLDIQGDGRPDLVETYFCGEGTLGATEWRVYLGEARGFSMTAVDWPVPDRVVGDAAFPYSGTSASHSCGGGNFYFSSFRTLDWNGDGPLDIMEFYACGQEGLGEGEWRLHAGLVDGFSDVPVPYTLPSLTTVGVDAPDRIIVPSSPGTCIPDLESSRYDLVDLDGDGPLDLVEFYACDADGIGTTQWRSFRGTNKGFDTEPTPWALPARTQHGNGSTSEWLDARQEAACFSDGGGSSYDVLDLTGDGIPDLVETWACGEHDLGLGHWRVFAGTSTGFAASPLVWTLPDRTRLSRDPSRFSRTTATGECAHLDSHSDYALVDIDGDERPDLVETDLCGLDELGIQKWRAFLNTGTGFASKPTPWGLPARSGSDPKVGFTRIDGSPGQCSTADETSAYEVHDMNGDGAPDLVETYLCGDGDVGMTHWRVYLGGCDL